MPASAEGGTDAAVRGPVRVERVSLPDLSPAPPAPFDEQELTLLAGLDYREQDALAASTRLRAAGLDADRAAAVLTQVARNLAGQISIRSLASLPDQLTVV